MPKIKKTQVKLLENIMRKEGLGNLTLTEHIDYKRDRGTQ